MADNAELQAKIAAIAGRITQHKHHPFFQPPQRPYHDRQQSAPARRGDVRWSPYGRGGRPVQASHRNRTLVLNSGGAQSPTAEDSGVDVLTDSAALVSARGTNNQLMTKDTYEREQKHKIEHKEQQRAAKRQKRNVQDQHRILSHLDSTGAGVSREITIEGIRFLLASDGSKLTRMSDNVPDKATPKKASVAGVDFHRTKNGNLVRASALKAPIRSTPNKPQCEYFTRHGTCPYGPRCHFAHDPDKVAICKDFLRTGTCALGDNCDMSHEMTYHRVSACQYFLRGNCTNSACRYPHVIVSPAAPVCPAFATLGFCAKGRDCDKRHVIECPEYANSGFCAKRESGKCTLPHPERASTLRKAVKRQSKAASDAESDISSDEENKIGTIDDIDSGDEDIVMTGFDDRHELSQQHDYVRFG